MILYALERHRYVSYFIFNILMLHVICIFFQYGPVQISELISVAKKTFS